MFMVPSGESGKIFVKEITRLINLWTEDSSLDNIDLKVIHTAQKIISQFPAGLATFTEECLNGKLIFFRSAMLCRLCFFKSQPNKNSKIKHHANVLLNWPTKEIHPILFDTIVEEMVLRVASFTKEGSSPPGLGVDGWKRMLISNSFGTASSDLLKSKTDFTKKL